MKKVQEQKNLEQKLWKICDNFRANLNLQANEYYLPVLGLIFLKYMYISFEKAEQEIMKNRPVRNGVVLPPDKDDFKSKGAIMLPKEAQWKWILAISDKNISSEELKNKDGEEMNSLGEILDNAMAIIEKETSKLDKVPLREYHKLTDDILRGLLKTFENEEIPTEVDKLGEIYEYFLGKFSLGFKNNEGVFFTPESLVNMIVNILEPTKGKVLDPACGSGGMFVRIKQYMDKHKLDCNKLITFYGHEKISNNARLCLMNILIRQLMNSQIAYGNEANTYYCDPFKLDGKCDYVLSNPPFNVDGVIAEKASKAGRLPFGLPEISKEAIKSANFLWISYFYSYLNETGKAGFVMPSISLGGTIDKKIREELVETKHIDLIMNVAPKFFQSGFKGGCSLWFLNKQKSKEQAEKILFIDASHYYTSESTSQNTWSEWQSKNLIAIVQLYRGQINKYQELLKEYEVVLEEYSKEFSLENNNKNYLSSLEMKREELFKDSEIAISNSPKKDRNKVKQEWNERQESLDEAISIAKEYNWIYSKFGNGEYKDISGICRAVDIKEVRENNYSLVPGIYVGSEEEEMEDDESFMKRMDEIHKELASLEKESSELMDRIQRNVSLWRK